MRAGDVRKDTLALLNIIMAWHAGIQIYDKHIKVAKDRSEQFKGLSRAAYSTPPSATSFEQTLCHPENPASLSYIIGKYRKFLDETEVGHRIKY